MAKREKKEPAKPSTAWMGTYGDMITLMLCFFVMLYDPSESDAVQMAALQASLSNNNPGGGISVSPGSLANLGNVVSSLPSIEKGRALGPAMKKAISSFAPEVKSNKITITSDERGLVISLASDTFFEEGSAELNIEEARGTLINLAKFFASPEVAGRRWRIEDAAIASLPRWILSVLFSCRNHWLIFVFACELFTTDSQSILGPLEFCDVIISTRSPL